jgi:hypothetical protein
MPATARSHLKGRSPYRPTEDDREIVHSMVIVGFDQPTICARLGIAGKTLRKHFREDLDNAYTMLVVSVRLQIIRKADEGDTQALIYLNRVLGWNDRPPRTGSNVNVGIGPVAGEYGGGCDADGTGGDPDHAVGGRCD